MPKPPSESSWDYTSRRGISSWFLQISGVGLQFRGLHMMYRNIIACHYMDTLSEVNSLIELAGFDKMNELR